MTLACRSLITIRDNTESSSLLDAFDISVRHDDSTEIRHGSMKAGVLTMPTAVPTVASIGVALTSVVIAGCAATTSSNQSRPTPSSGLTGSVWVANEASNSVSVINASNHATVATLTGVSGPHNVQAASDGTVWATSSGGLAIDLEPRTYRVAEAVVVGEHPTHVVTTPDGRQAWVTNYGDDSVTIINTRTGMSQDTVAVGDGPHGMRFSSDGGTAYVALLDAGKLAIIDTTTLQVRRADVGPQPVQVAPTQDGAFVYVTLAGKSAVAKVDPRTRRVTAEISVPSPPAQALVTPDGRSLLVANQGTDEAPGNTVSRIDTTSDEVTDTVPTGFGPHGLTTDPDSRFAYVTNMHDDTLSVIDLADFTVTTTVPTGSEPNGVTFVASPVPSQPRGTVPLQIDGAAPSDSHASHHS